MSPPEGRGGLRLIDRYILRLAVGPMIAAMSVTLVSMLLERILRLLDALQASSNRFGFVAELAANLAPHYLGLTLPTAFFVAIFIVLSRLSDGSEIDALLAGGVSLTRIVAPYLVLGVILSMVSLILFGFIQPYSRYAYQAVMHAAENAGWNGRVQVQSFVSANNRVTMTADGADQAGRRLERLFIREITDDGLERITTARAARIEPTQKDGTVALVLSDGQQIRPNSRGEDQILAFKHLRVEVPLIGAAKLLRQRGGDERELTLIELVQKANEPHPTIPRQTLLAELYARLARAFSLPLLPMLALPLGLAAKRGGRAPGMIIAALLLVSFQHLLQLGESFAASGRASALAGVGLPYGTFAALCFWIFFTSRKRPGETPIGVAIDYVMAGVRRLQKQLTPRRRAAA